MAVLRPWFSLKFKIRTDELQRLDIQKKTVAWASAYL